MLQSAHQTNTLAKMVVTLALALIALSAAQLVYRFSLPTDGWLVFTTETFENPDWVYWQNLAGAPSALQQEDIVLAVDGRNVTGQATSAAFSTPAQWQTGQTIPFTVRRQSSEQIIQVPIIRWTSAALWNHLAARPEQLIGLLSGLFLVGLALFTIFQRPNIPAASALLFLCAVYLSIAISGLLPDGLSVQFNQLAFYTTSFFSYAIFGILLAPAILTFTLLFPQPKSFVRKRPMLGLAPFAVGLAIGAIVFMPNGPAAVGWLGTMTMIILAILSLIHSGLTQRDSLSKMQFIWAVGGLLLGLSLMLLVFPAAAEWVDSPFLAQLFGSGFSFGFMVIGTALAIAILHGLFDLDLLLNRALVYIILTIGVIAIYIIIVGYLSMIFQTEGNILLSLAATGLVAVAFAPLRDGIQRGVNRLMYGVRDEPYQLINRLGQQMDNAVEPASLLATAVSTIAQALKLPYVAITLIEEEKYKLMAAYGTSVPHVHTFPLLFAGSTIGQLIAAYRSPNESLTKADLRLLGDLSRQIGAAAQASRLTNDLELARLRLAHERGEARRQLGADLHDGVGHSLVGLTRQVEQTLNFLEQDSTQSRVLLQDVQRQLVDVTADVRRLAHRLFPPEVALLGLAGALQERVEQFTTLQIQFNASQPFPQLPAEIETAVYYIALEALTNIEKHAAASACSMTLAILVEAGNNLVCLDIIDNGGGMVSPAKQGVGLLSMQARAAEIGGVCTIESRPQGGTAVKVRIPFQREGR